MKRILCLLLILALLPAALLTSCKKEEPPETERYLPTAFFEQLRTRFEAKENASEFKLLHAGEAPYTIRDVFAISNGKLLYLHIPVMKTGAMDEEGNFTLTLYIVNNSYNGLRTGLTEEKKIKINAEEHGLTEKTNNICKFIRVDVSAYEIQLTDTQTLAVMSATDTLYPAYLTELASKEKNGTFTLYKKEFARATGYFGKVGSTEITHSQGTVMLDFEWELTPERAAAAAAKAEEEAAFTATLAELKATYGGKYYSVIGDSISTFEGINNNTDYNSTIGNNNVYYNDCNENGTPSRNHIFYDYTDTYWGRLTKELGMQLCVNNAWSGAYTYETTDKRYALNMYTRASQLHQDGGTPSDPSDDIKPDVIIVFMGTNDLLHNKEKTCDPNLYKELSKVTANKAAVTDAWFEQIAAKADALPSIEPNTAYTSWEAAYALSLRLMKQLYPEAEIVCLTLPQCNHSNSSQQLVTRYNVCITAMAEHFGATVVKTGNALPKDTCHAYGADSTTVHPSVYGHELMFRELAKTLFDKKKNA